MMRYWPHALLVCVAAFLAVPLSAFAEAASDDGILFQQDFTKLDGLAAAGWRIEGDPGEVSSWSLSKNGLDMKFRHRPYKGGSLTHAIPSLPSRGEIIIDLNVGVSAAKYDHFSLKIDLPGFMIAFKNYGRHALLRYYRGEWAVVTDEMPLARRAVVKIMFDTARDGLVQYFVDDMEGPVYVESGVRLDSLVENPTVSLGNYGLSLGEVGHHINSILISKLSEPADTEVGAARKGTALLLNGIASERYNIPAMAKELGVNEMKMCSVTNMAPALSAHNTFRIDHLPDLTTPAPEYIIMADFPMGAGLLHRLVVDKILADVSHGSHLVVLGGVFTLNKGGGQPSGFDGIMPVSLANPWAIKEHVGADIFPDGKLRFSHALAPTGEAAILSAADGGPLWLTKSCGEGRVTVFLGMPCGASDSRMFWQSTDWPSYAAGMIMAAVKSH